MSNDVYAELMASKGKTGHMLLNRLTILVLGLVAMLLVIDKEIKVYKFVLDYGWAILGAAFGPQLILVLFWKRASYAGCVCGMATGFAVALLWMLKTDNKIAGVEVYNLPLAFLAALMVNILFSLLFPRRDEEFVPAHP